MNLHLPILPGDWKIPKVQSTISKPFHFKSDMRGFVWSRSRARTWSHLEIQCAHMDSTCTKRNHKNISKNKTIHNSTKFTLAIDPASNSPMGHFFCVTFPKATVTTSPGKPRGIKNSLVTSHRCSVCQRNFTMPPPSSKAWLGERAIGACSISRGVLSPFARLSDYPLSK